MKVIVPEHNTEATVAEVESRDEKILAFGEACNTTEVPNGIMAYELPPEGSDMIYSVMTYPYVKSLAPIYELLTNYTPPVPAGMEDMPPMMNMQPRVENFEVYMNDKGDLQTDYSMEGSKDIKCVVWRKYIADADDRAKAEVTKLTDIMNVTVPIEL